MRKRIFYFAFAMMMLLPFLLNGQSVSWRAAEGPLTTPWTNQVTPDNVHNEYPRPQMTREKWKNLNGLWAYKITSSLQDYEGAKEKTSDGDILVPFPIESDLSGIKKALLPEQKLWYNRTFVIPLP